MQGIVQVFPKHVENEGVVEHAGSDGTRYK